MLHTIVPLQSMKEKSEAIQENVPSAIQRGSSWPLLLFMCPGCNSSPHFKFNQCTAVVFRFLGSFYDTRLKVYKNCEEREKLERINKRDASA